MKQLQSWQAFKRKLLVASIAPLALGLSSLASAQELIEEVLVIGSHIKSSRSDAVSPVEIIDNDFINRSGAFTVAELTAKLSVNSGSENHADSFTSGEIQGTSNVNLRGLGLSSTLVLINGRRQTITATRANDGSVFVDTSTIPLAALDRIEILKEGATSAYGSDAVAGVVNYVLREDFAGFEFSGGYQTIANDSQNTLEASFLWGFGNDKTWANISGALLRQDPLSGSDRTYLVNNAISTLGRSFGLSGPDVVASGDYAGSYSLGENVPDPNCTENGGVLIPQALGTRCGFFYGPRFNIVNEEQRNQIYGHLSHEFSDTLTLSAEVGYTKHEVLDNPQSPSYPNLSFPVILPGQAGSPFGVPVVWLGRPLGSDFPSPDAPRENDTWRAVLELDGAFSDNWIWNGAVTYSENERLVTQPDTISSRLEAGLAGVGGPNGDQTFNVFDSSANSAEMIAYMSVDTFLWRTADLAVFDFVTTGDLFEFGDRSVGIAAGAQYRDEGYSEKRNEIYTQSVDPNNGEIIPVDLIFLGGGLPVDVDRQSYAVFAEIQLPLTESLEVNLAARYENLDTADSLNPKLSVRWQPIDSLVLRGSVSTAFREPSLIQLHGRETSLQGLQDFNPDGTSKGGVVFVRVNETGNPALVPEESSNYNIGAIWSPTDSFNMRLDYWRFEYEDVITVENAQGKIQDDLNGDDIIRVAGDNSQLAGVNVDFVNAANVETDGLDLYAFYEYSTNSVGDFGVQLTATHFLSYEIPTADGGIRDVAGFFNHDNFARSIPETKANLSVDWTMGSHSATASAFYVDSYVTTRTVPPGSSQQIDDWTTVDLQYAYNLDLSASQMVFSLGIKNAFDEEPSVVYDAANLSYDPKHHDPRGRMYYVKAKWGF